MCCNSWGRKESDTIERLNLTELNSFNFSGLGAINLKVLKPVRIHESMNLDKEISPSFSLISTLNLACPSIKNVNN